MTIAIGLLADDGIVFAADTQVSESNFIKSDAGKIALSLVPINNREMATGYGARIRSFGIGGAGNLPYVQELQKIFSQRFKNLSTPESLIDPHDEFQDELSRFYRAHVRPFDRYPPQERPEFWLLMGTQLGHSQRLWVTERNTLIQEQAYAAV